VATGKLTFPYKFYEHGHTRRMRVITQDVYFVLFGGPQQPTEDKTSVGCGCLQRAYNHTLNDSSVQCVDSRMND